jgi:hypothetical protein
MMVSAVPINIAVGQDILMVQTLVITILVVNVQSAKRDVEMIQVVLELSVEVKE